MSSAPPPSDWQIYRRAIGLALLGVAGTGALVGMGAGVEPARILLSRFAAPTTPALEQRSEPDRVEPAPLTEPLRRKGFHECNPHDPIGLGPYAPYRNLNVGRITIPQKGAYTDDMGYDVLVHFHGQSPVRKTLVQVARGVAYVGIDKGLGSGPYSTAFAQADLFRTLLRSIGGALKKHAGDERAHIRNLGLSAWSAGYGAINEILKYDADRVDAVILLDGLHAAWNPATTKRDGSLRSLSRATLDPTFRFAERALQGEKLFVFSHSQVDPERYPSTEATANLLLSELALERSPVDPGPDPFGQIGSAEWAGFHLWSFLGKNEAAHCTHIRHMARAVQLVEQSWNTPAMDRNVPHTPAPKLGGPDGEDGMTFELVDAGPSSPRPPELSAAAALLPPDDPPLPPPREPTAHEDSPQE
jgi:hypothetical protein